MRGRGRGRGWGGVGVMATLVGVLALAVVLLLPLAREHRESRAVQKVADTTQAAAETCRNPEAQTLRPSTVDGSTIAAIKARTGQARKLIVGVDQNSYRWGYRNPNNKDAALEGFDIDLVHKIAENILGDPNAVQFRAIPTNERINAIKKGEVDMVVRTMTINCERIKDVAFSAPYFRTGQQVLAPKDTGITGYDKSLAGKKVCVALGSTAKTKLEENNQGATPLVVPNQLDCLVRLQLGEADAIITDGALAASQAAQDPTLKLEGTPFTTEFYGVAMKKDANDLVSRVNQVLAQYRSGGWQDSYRTWLSQTMGPNSAPYLPDPPVYLRTS
ncbi:sugar-binding protein [Streptomyces sp. V2]|nr:MULTISPECIES: glutamate ABC transporter substrate-binding protein [Streptomyces]PWG11976.1 sugar-binding protein [Streptomyces sp. V2]QZZ27872.1 glutamate ABC transporter substrate-binding protein [Streptomyces sp. ST1015]